MQGHSTFWICESTIFNYIFIQFRYENRSLERSTCQSSIVLDLFLVSYQNASVSHLTIALLDCECQMCEYSTFGIQLYPTSSIIRAFSIMNTAAFNFVLTSSICLVKIWSQKRELWELDHILFEYRGIQRFGSNIWFNFWDTAVSLFGMQPYSTLKRLLHKYTLCN